MLENDYVKLIKKGNKRIIKKRILIPFTKEEIISQHDYVNYLYDNGIKVAKILGLYKYNNNYYEYQEYVDNDNSELDIYDMVRSIAIFHTCSKNYKKDVTKKKVYNFDFECNDYKLKRFIIGYDEKYNIYPSKNYDKYKEKMGFTNNEKYNRIMEFYNYCFNYIKNKFEEPNCIIHNDINRFNILNHNNMLYLIDFDLCIKNYEIVDIVDIIISKYYGLDNIISNFDEIKKVVKNIVKIYNEYTSANISEEDIFYQMFLKIVSYNCYVVLNDNTKDVFDNNFNSVYKIKKLVKEGYYANN